MEKEVCNLCRYKRGLSDMEGAVRRDTNLYICWGHVQMLDTIEGDFLEKLGRFEPLGQAPVGSVELSSSLA